MVVVIDLQHRIPGTFLTLSMKQRGRGEGGRTEREGLIKGDEEEVNLGANTPMPYYPNWKIRTRHKSKVFREKSAC